MAVFFARKPPVCILKSKDVYPMISEILFHSLNRSETNMTRVLKRRNHFAMMLRLLFLLFHLIAGQELSSGKVFAVM